MLAAEWQQSETGREAKFYRLTAKGRAQLKIETANWASVSEAIALVLKAADGSASPANGDENRARWGPIVLVGLLLAAYAFAFVERLALASPAGTAVLLLALLAVWLAAVSKSRQPSAQPPSPPTSSSWNACTRNRLNLEPLEPENPLNRTR